MPPKGTANSYAPASLVATLTAADIRNPNQLDARLLRKIYRLEDDVVQDQPAVASTSSAISPLANNSKRAIIHPFHACQNAWDTPEKCKEALSKLNVAQTKKLKAVAKQDTVETPPAGGDAKLLDPLCTHARCKDNPRCLNWLGQALWEADDAFETFVKHRGLPDNPIFEARDPAIPVGLKNLGATCYVNSYLQVWFRDEPFRRGVYSCMLDNNKTLEEQPLYNLQVTFAALQEGQVRAFNPTDLVKSLSIDTSEQQDAQEFAKLLMTLLEQQFAQQQNPVLKTLIAKQFEGKIKYGTECSSCHTQSETTSSFKELEIPLKHNRHLEEQIQAILETEYLTGENKYRCERCNCLRNAERYTKLTELPPVLHFSLMRFGYDFKADERKKSFAHLKFPKSINMAEHMSPRGREALWYDLRAILSHRGSSAYHGHYVAKIFDTKQRKWFEFDDETVTEVNLRSVASKTNTKRTRTPSPAPALKRRKSSQDDPINVDSDASDDGPLVTSARRGPYKASVLDAPQPSDVRKKRRMVIEDDDDLDESMSASDDVIGSRDAYMLVYVRRESTESGSLHTRPASALEADSEVPPVVKRRLSELDREYTKALADFSLEEKKCLEDFEDLRKRKRSVYQVWNAASDVETSLLVDSSLLEAWLTVDIRPTKKKITGKKPLTSQNATDDEDSDCVEVVSSVAAKQRGPMEYYGPLRVSESEKRPQQNGSSGHGQSSAKTSPAKDGAYLPRIGALESNGNSSANGLDPSITPSARLSPAQAESASRPSSSEPDAAQRDGTVNELDSTNLLCHHGGLMLSAAPRVKRVSQAGVAALVSQGAVICPDITTSDSLCRICVWEPFADRTYIHGHMKMVAEFQRAGQASHANPSWVSSPWLTDWSKDRPAMHLSGHDNDPAPDSGSYNADVLCQHGLLQPDSERRTLVTERQRQLLQALYPGWCPVPFHHVECRDCRLVHQRVLTEQEELRRAAKIEKNSKALKRISATHDYKQIELTATREGEAVRAVPKDWISAWRSWLKRPVSLPRPGKIDLRPSLCEHYCLTSDMNIGEDRKAFEMIMQSEWEALCEIYGSKRNMHIAVWRSRGGRYETDPVPCEACRFKKLSQFNKIDIQIDYLLAEDLDPDTNLPRQQDDAFVLDREVSPPATAGTRRSTRTRRAPGSSLKDSKRPKRRSSNIITVKRADTLKEIRMQIEGLTEIPVLYQRVFFKGRELEDAAVTVEAIGTVRGEVLQVLELVIEDIDDDKLGDLPGIPTPRIKAIGEKTKTKVSKINNRPEGFTGTALSGFDVVDHSQARPAPSTNIPGTCKQCTFINEAGTTQCTLCEGALW